MSGSERYWIVTVLAVHVLCLVSYGEAACDNDTQFTCCGGTVECVDRSLQYDGRFDCADGSDESPAINETLADRGCCDRPDAFHCLSGSCVAPASILDGYNDCNNGEDALADDEHKYIGTNCEKSLDPALCCPCEIFVANSECVDKTGDYLCYCISGYMAVDRGMTCTKRKFGDPCEVDPDCYDAVDNTVCPSDTKLCACRNGWYVVNNEYCVRRIITDSCTKDLDCSPAVANSNCTNNICQCNSGYIVNADKTACNLRALGDTCNVNTDCADAMPNSLCVDGRCTCAFKYSPNEDNSGCALIKIGDDCVTDPSDECEAQVENSECREGLCTCGLGYRPSPDKASCVLVVLGDSCVSNDVCTIPNSECKTGSCQCRTGYKPSTDTLRCYQLILGGESCGADPDCNLYVNNSECVGGTCTCELGYFRDLENTRCTKLELGKGVCYRDPGCEASVANSVCSDGQCRCKPGYFRFTASQCNRRDIGSYCEADDACARSINNTFCNPETRQCQCRSGYSPDAYFANCVVTAIGESCEADAACTVRVAHSQCTDRRCRCMPGYVAHEDGLTCRARHLTDRCGTDGDCSPVIASSECTRGRCSCVPGYRPSASNTSCDKIPINELPCSTDKDCQDIAEGSVCGPKGFCSCDVPGGYYTTPDGLYCEPYKNGEAQCVVNTTCTDHDPEARCIDGICDCRIGFYPKDPDKNCAASKTGVIPCTGNSYCARYMSGTACVSGYCQCACGHYETNNGYQCTKIMLGESCSVLPLANNASMDCGCAIANASCQNGDCLCLPGYEAYGNYTCNSIVATTSGNSCSNVMEDCPWIVAVAVVGAVALLGVVTGVGIYLYKKYKVIRLARAVTPNTAYGTSVVNVRSTTPGNKYPDEVLDGLVKKDVSVFYTPEPTPTPTAGALTK